MILSTGGVCMVGGMHGGGCAWPGGVHARGACMAGGHVWPGGMHGQGACMGGVCGGGMHDMHVPPGQILRLRHTDNERAVRILLECILVY